jgi:hypothetical protein
MSDMRPVARRRRTLLWWLVGLLLFSPLAIRTLRSIQGPSDYLPRRFTGAPGEELGRLVRDGPVQVILLDARRLAPDEVGLHLVITADGLSSSEELVAQPGLSGTIEVFPVGGYGAVPPPPPQMTTTGRGTALEAWVALAPGIERVSFDVAALFLRRTSGPGPPPPIRSDVRPPSAFAGISAPATGPHFCAVPLNDVGQCALYKDEGRLLATVRLDLSALGVPAWIWQRS